MKVFVIALLTLIALASAQDDNCKVKDPNDGTCQICSFGFYIGSDRLCVLLPKNSNCASYDMHSGVCLGCWSRQYIDSSSGYCFDVSWQCKTFESFKGKCESCWWGELKDGVCH